MKGNVTHKGNDAMAVPCIIQIAVGNNGSTILQAGHDNQGNIIADLQSENEMLKEEIKWLRSLVDTMVGDGGEYRTKLAIQKDYQNGNK